MVYRNFNVNIIIRLIIIIATSIWLAIEIDNPQKVYTKFLIISTEFGVTLKPVANFPSKAVFIFIPLLRIIKLMFLVLVLVALKYLMKKNYSQKCLGN